MIDITVLSIFKSYTVHSLEWRKHFATNFNKTSFIKSVFFSSLYINVCSVSKDLTDNLHLSAKASLTRPAISKSQIGA